MLLGRLLFCRGRVRIQLLGFTMVSILFFISAAKYPTLIKPNNIGVFQFIYFFSSFWGQVCHPHLYLGCWPVACGHAQFAASRRLPT